MSIKSFFSDIFKKRPCGDTLELNEIPNYFPQKNQNIIDKETLEEENYTNEVIVKKSTPTANRSMEIIQNAMSDLVNQLKGINENLTLQSQQNSKLLSHLQDLPEIVKSLPNSVKSQTESTAALVEQLKMQAKQNIEFLEVIEKIPTETGKQTDVLENISGQLSASAETDIHFAESFNNFKGSLENLDKTAQNQTETISEMSKTFAASDRYLKYLISVQSRRFMWAFLISIGISAFCIITMLIIIAVIVAK